MNNSSETFTIPMTSIRVKSKKSKPVGHMKSNHVNRRLEEKSLSLNDIKLIMETLTDLQYAKKIKVASILSPKEIAIPKLRLVLDGLKSAPDPKLLPLLEAHFRVNYPLEKKLFEILGKVLFDHGSYTLAVIPPSELDRVLKQSFISGENFDTLSDNNDGFKTGALGKGFKSDFLNDAGISLSDNVLDMKKAGLRGSSKNDRILNMLSGESVRMSGVKPTGGTVSFTVPTETDARENADPIVFHFPPDCLVPVFDPTDPSRHLGYYVAIDPSAGMPITRIKESNINQKLIDQLNEKDSIGAKLGVHLSGLPLKEEKLEGNDAADAFLEQFEERMAKELKNSLTDGIYGNVEVANHSEVYQLMLYKALREEKVKMVYLPSELVTYFAFDHDSKGMGVSLIEKTKLISSLRTLVMMSDILANIKNSTPITEVEIELDEDDPDQSGSVEAIVNNISRLDKNRSPVGIFNVSDVITSLRKANTRIKVSGGDVFPNTRTSFNDTQSSVTKVDQDLIEFLAKQHHSGIDVPSELIDRAMEGEFAVSTHTTNHLWSMTNMLVQSDYIYCLNDFIKKYIGFSGRLLKDIDNLKGDLTVKEILDALTVQFPKHDSASIEAITENFDAVSDLIDKIVEQYVSSDLLSDLVEDSDNLDDIGDVVQSQIAAYFKRRWLVDNNIMPEITSKLFVDLGDDFSLSDEITEFNDEMIASITSLVDGAIKISGKSDKKTRRAKARAEKQRAKGDTEEVVEQPATPVVAPGDEAPAGDDGTGAPVEDVGGEPPVEDTGVEETMDEPPV